VTSCKFVGIYRRFSRTCYICQQTMTVMRVVAIYWTTRRHISEHSIFIVTAVIT